MINRSIKAEIIKILYKRSLSGVIIFHFLAMPILAVGVILLATNSVGSNAIIASVIRSPDDLLLLIFSNGKILCALFGLLIFTSEYGTGVICRTYHNFPNRINAILGKAITATCMVFLVSLLSSGIGVSILNMSKVDYFMISASALISLSYATSCAIITLLSFGIGLVFSKTLPSLITMFALIYIIPDVLKTVFDNFLPNAAFIISYLPVEASAAGIQNVLTEGAGGIGTVQGTLSAMITSAVIVIIGLVVQLKKDVN